MNLKDDILDALRKLELGSGIIKTSDKSQIVEAHGSWDQTAIMVISGTASPFFDFYDTVPTLTNQRDSVLSRHGCYLTWINAAVAGIYKHDTAGIYDSQKIYDEEE